MTCKKVHPRARLYHGTYPKGVNGDKKTMKPYEKCLQPFWLKATQNENHKNP